MMKSLVCVEPGKFEYKQTEEPKISAGEVILKIKRIGICGTDLHAFEGTQPYFTYPRVLGHELAGEIVDGSDLKECRIGDVTTFIPYFRCGKCIACRSGKPNCCASIKVCGVHVDGGMAEYLSVPSYALLPSSGLSYDDLALVEPLAIGAHAVRRAAVMPDEFVLVVGAGPIGLGIMEFARIAGGRVIAMDINEKRLQFCKDVLKVKHTVNATEDLLQQIGDITNGDFPTVVIDATGSRKAIIDAFRYMAHGARYVLVGLQKGDISFSHPEFHKREATLMSSRNATREDFDQVINALATKKVNAQTFITHRTRFDRIKDEFPGWLEPANGVIKAMVEVD